MAMVDADWTITRSTGDIRYIGNDHGGAAPSYASVIDFHRWLQNFADNPEFSGDDELDIIDKNPSERSTDNIITLVNGFYITAADAEHLFDGSIIQDEGDTIFDGVVNFGNVGVRIQLLQDGTVIDDDWWNYNIGGSDDTSAGAATMTDSTAPFTDSALIGYVIKNVTDGSEALITANSTTVITGTLGGGSANNWTSGDAYLISEGLNNDAGSGISSRWMIPTRLNGVDIDRRRIIGTNRTFERTFGEFTINQANRGNNVLALSDSNDLNNTTAEATVAGWTTIVNQEGLRLIDISEGGSGAPEEYYSEWTRAAFTINQYYERMKWLSRDGTSSQLNKLNGEDFRGNTHSFAYDTPVGSIPQTNDEIAFGTAIAYDNKGDANFRIGEALHENTAIPVWKARVLMVQDDGATGILICDVETGTVLDPSSFTGQTSFATADVQGTPTAVTTGGVFRVYALDDDGATGNVYGQLMKGRAPLAADTLFYITDASTHSIDVTAITERAVSTPFVGVSTGSALIGAYGLGMEFGDTSDADTFFDLGNNAITPPNNVTFTLEGLENGEDYALVGTNNASDFLFTHYTLNGLLNGGSVTAVVVNGSIDSDTPTTGTIRVTRANGLISRHEFTSRTGSTFTIGSTDFSTNNALNGANTFTSYVDVLATGASESMSYVYNGDRTVFIRVRDAGTGGDLEATKTFETTAVIGSNGVTATNIRTPDV